MLAAVQGHPHNGPGGGESGVGHGQKKVLVWGTDTFGGLWPGFATIFVQIQAEKSSKDVKEKCFPLKF